MLKTIFNEQLEASSVKQLVAHILHNMNFTKYQKFLQRAARYPEQDHKFVLLEYVQSPCDALISRREHLPGTRVSIHSLISHPTFSENMKRLFADPSDKVPTTWYSRRKLEYPGPRLSDTRQLMVCIRRTQEEDDYSDMPPLIFNSAAYVDIPWPVLNPEDDTPQSRMIPPATTTVSWSGLNQTIWTPSYSYLTG